MRVLKARYKAPYKSSSKYKATKTKSDYVKVDVKVKSYYSDYNNYYYNSGPDVVVVRRGGSSYGDLIVGIIIAVCIMCCCIIGICYIVNKSRSKV